MEMKFTDDNRGVSEVIGAILMFGLLIALMAVLQTQAIPAANEKVEFNHNQEVQSNLIEFQEVASRTAAQGSTESVKVQMGATYPSRLLFFNPQNPSGTIRTVENGTVEIDNVRATDPTVRKHINGDLTNLETKRIEYTPQYNEMRESPVTVLEYGVLYNDFGDRHLIQNEGNVVNGNHIDLMFFTGNLSRTTGGAMSLNAQPSSAPARTVTVEPVSGSDVTIAVPTRLPSEDWEQILSEEIQNGNVERVNDISGNKVEIVLDGSVSRYTIRMPVIGVGNNVKQPDPVYVTGGNGHEGTVRLQSGREVTFEIRDKYNNPVRNEELNVTLESPAVGSLDTNTVQTNDRGRATVFYEAPDSADTPLVQNVRASFKRDPSSGNFDAANNPEDYKYKLRVIENDRPTGPGITANLAITSTSCAGTADGGLLGTTVAGGEAADIEIDWSATTSSPAVVSDVSIRMVDNTNGQLAASTSYSPNTVAPSETVILRDQRMDKRQNGESCGKTYTVYIDALTDGGRPASDQDSDSV